MSSKVYIVEDHPLVRRMVSEAVEMMPDLSVCGASASAEEALERLSNVEADVVLIDMALPGMSGTELVAALQQRDTDLRCLVVSGHSDAAYVRRALAAGSCGYVLKGNVHELEGAIRQVLAGNTYLSRPLRQVL